MDLLTLKPLSPQEEARIRELSTARRPLTSDEKLELQFLMYQRAGVNLPTHRGTR